MHTAFRTEVLTTPSPDTKTSPRGTTSPQPPTPYEPQSDNNLWTDTCNVHPNKEELTYALTQSESDLAPLTDTEISLLKRYTGDDYSMFNTGYSSGSAVSVHASERTILNSLLVRQSDRNSRSVYRGVRSTHPMFDTCNNDIELWVKKNLFPGSTYSSPDFMSASISREVAKSYAGVGIAKHDCLLFEINTTYGICVESITQYADEMEVVLPMNHSFVVDSVSEVGVTERNQRVFVARLSDSDTTIP